MDITTNLSEGHKGMEGPQVGTKVFICISFYLVNVLRYSDTLQPTEAKEEPKEEETGLFHLQA